MEAYNGSLDKLKTPVKLKTNKAENQLTSSLHGKTNGFDLIFALETSQNLRNTTFLSSIINTKYTTKSLDAFGATTAGKLTLKSPLMPAQLGIITRFEGTTSM
jgi:hypothetical protein